MDKHADDGLPFLSLEYDDGYQEETQEGTSTMPSYDYIEATNIDGSNVYDAASYRHLLSIAVDIRGVSYGTPGCGVNITTEDGRHLVVVPVPEYVAYRRLNDIERKAFEMAMRSEIKDDGNVEEL